jgi:hypothetical protein
MIFQRDSILLAPVDSRKQKPQLLVIHEGRTTEAWTLASPQRSNASNTFDITCGVGEGDSARVDAGPLLTIHELGGGLLMLGRERYHTTSVHLALRRFQRGDSGNEALALQGQGYWARRARPETDHAGGK